MEKTGENYNPLSLFVWILVKTDNDYPWEEVISCHSSEEEASDAEDKVSEMNNDKKQDFCRYFSIRKKLWEEFEEAHNNKFQVYWCRSEKTLKLDWDV